VQCFQEQVGFEVETAVNMKSSVSWDITPCSPLTVNQPLEGICPVHLYDIIFFLRNVFGRKDDRSI
jgi:hypothetical protein